MEKQTYQANCVTYGVSSCKEWLGLTCAVILVYLSISQSKTDY